MFKGIREMFKRKNSNLGRPDSHTESAENLSKNNEKLTEEEKSKMRKNAHKLDFSYLMIFDEAVQLLLSKKEEGENCFIDFNGKKLYSVDIENENDAYLQFCGKTKSQVEMEREKRRQEYEAKRKREELEALEKIPGWIEEGKKYIDESKWGDWEKYVNSSARDFYHGTDVESTLELLRMIDNGESWKDIQNVFDNQGHSGFTYSVVRNCVIDFSKKGKEAENELKE